MATIFIAEAEILEAAQAAIVTATGLPVTSVMIDIDGDAPPVSAQSHISICPGGLRPGPHHDNSGGVMDLIYSIDVVVLREITAVPKDRMKNPYLYHTRSLNAICNQIIEALDWSNTFLAAVNAALTTAGDDSGYAFIELLRLQNIDPKPKIVDSEKFGRGTSESKNPRAGLERRITFGGLRRIIGR